MINRGYSALSIMIADEDLVRCRRFSEECAKNTQRIEFGQNDTGERSVQEAARDILIGKLAEVAFASMLWEQYSLRADLDFGIYPRGIWDSEDVLINGWRIDVKGSRSGSEWLLIEWNKLRFRIDERRLPHVFIFVTVDWDRQSDQPGGSADLVGYAFLNDLRNDVNNGTITLLKGSKLPGKKVRMQADNYARNVKLLRKDWTDLVGRIKRSIPPDTEGYPRPPR
jgi:hypothetical protein